MITRQDLIDRGFIEWPTYKDWLVRENRIDICINIKNDDMPLISLEFNNIDNQSHLLPFNTTIEDIDHLIRILQL